MSRFVVMAVAAAALGLVQPASAADMPVKAYTAPVVAPAANWTGFYLGGGIGLRSTETDWTTTSLEAFGILVGPNDPNSEPLNGTAFRYSGYLGYNWQFAPQWLIGVEGDIGGANKTVSLAGTSIPGASFTNASDSFGVRTTWDASARARLGYLVMPKTLLYVTGGAAWQQLEAQRNFCAGCGGFFPYTSNVSDTRLGWTVGGGLEVMAWNNWLMRAEYRYADFGTVSLSDGDAFRQAMYDIDLKTHTVTFGVSYLFGGTVIGH